METNQGKSAGGSFAFAAPVRIPQGEGSFLIKPGKPLTRLTLKQFAAEIGVNDESVRRYIHAGIVPANLVERAGHRKYLISAAAIEIVKGFFNRRLAD